MQKSGQIEPCELNRLKVQHTIAIDEMIAAVDRANDLKCRIWAIECERDQNKKGD
jgi:hypothetical protein